MIKSVIDKMEKIQQEKLVKVGICPYAYEDCPERLLDTVKVWDTVTCLGCVCMHHPDAEQD